MNNNDLRSDEDVLLAARMGDGTSELALWERYFGLRHMLCNAVAYEANQQLDEWSRGEAFFSAYTNAIRGYQFVGVLFRTYFNEVLRRELITAVATKVKLEGGATHFRLDETVSTEDGATYVRDSLEDPCGDTPDAYMAYLETLEKLEITLEGVDPLSRNVFNLLRNGYSLEEAGRICGVTKEKAKYLSRRVHRALKKSMRKIHEPLERPDNNPS